MNTFLAQKLFIKQIVTIIVITLIILTSCSTTETAELPTISPVPDSQADIEPSPTDVPDQSVPSGTNQVTETPSILTETMEPTATMTTEPQETAISVSEQEDAAAAGQASEDNTTILEQPRVETFTFSTSNQPDPEGVLQEIAFAFGAGGPDDLGYCEGTFEQPGLGVPTIEEAMLHDRIDLLTCGWQTNENVTLSITYPDGRIDEPQVQVTENSPYPTVSISFKTDILNDPPGEYQFTLSGESGTINHLINIQIPDDPQFFLNDDGTIILYNFEQKKLVRVFAYISTNIVRGYSAILSLYTWQSFQVDHNGNLIIESRLDERIEWFASIGEISGEVRPNSISSSVGSEKNYSTIAAADPDSTEVCNLSINDSVIVGAIPDEMYRLWSQPDALSGNLVDEEFYREEGYQGSIVSGPQWGRVRQDIELFGWMWEILVQEDGAIGWIWQEQITECIN